MVSGANFSPCGVYRYLLWRVWGHFKPRLLWVMLNPSTADEMLDDQTIKTIVAIARLRGYGGVEVVNLFAYRATNPADLKAAGWLVGPENDAWIFTAVRRTMAVHGGRVVFAWGAHAPEWRVRQLLKGWDYGTPFRLDSKKTTNGNPRHPLYHKHDTQLIDCRFPEDFA